LLDAQLVHVCDPFVGAFLIYSTLPSNLLTVKVPSRPAREGLVERARRLRINQPLQCAVGQPEISDDQWRSAIYQIKMGDQAMTLRLGYVDKP
jgi:hypothetical protein